MARSRERPSRRSTRIVALGAAAFAWAVGSCVGEEASLQQEPLSCAEGQADCAGACVDLGLDKQHCGACGQACPQGEFCSLGACDTECNGGTLECDDRCVDPMIDPQHCGDCDAACPGGDVCALGSCGQPCDSGLIDCGGSCVDVTTESDHCGGCHQPCADGETCTAGKCYGESCRDLLSNDPSLVDGLYFIDPDGPGGEAPFEVACNMSVDGGGWIQLSLADSQSLLMAENAVDNPWTKCADNSAKHFAGIAQTEVIADVEGNGDHVFALSYLNPLTEEVYSEAQIAALRSVIDELSTTTRMVAVTADDDAGDWQTTMTAGHEVYIRGASMSLVLLTPGEDGDCGGGAGNYPLGGSESGFYLWHSTAAGSATDGTTTGAGSLPGLGIGDLLPVEVQLSVHSGGGVAFGWEKPIFLVR
jgi:hypothetical protein